MHAADYRSEVLPSCSTSSAVQGGCIDREGGGPPVAKGSGRGLSGALVANRINASGLSGPFLRALKHLGGESCSIRPSSLE